MMRKLDSLVPAFLKDFDKYLLLHYPRLWATKVHYLAFLVAGALTLIGLRAFLPGIDLASPPDPETWFFVALAPVIGVFFLWAYTASVFEVERFFGITSRMSQLGVQLIYLASILMLGAIPFVYANVLSDRLAHAVDDTTFGAEVNALNLGDVFFPMSEHDQRSLPEQRFGYYWYMDDQVLGILEAEALVNHFQRMDRHDKLAAIGTYQDLVEKYSGYRPEGEPEAILRDYQKGELAYAWNYEFDAAIGSVSNSINLITQAKERHFAFQRDNAHWISGFMLFLVWLLFMIYTRLQGRQFLVAIVSGFALFIVAAILTVSLHEIFRIGSDGLIGTVYLGLFGLLAGQAFAFARATRRLRFWSAIGLALATVMTPFVPLVVSEMLNLHMQEESLLIWGVLLSFALWTLAFNRRFVGLQAAPQQD